MSTKRNLYEVFDEFLEAPDRESRRQVLRNNNSYALRSILRANFNPNIRFTIESIPTYNSSNAPIGLGYSSIDAQIKKMYIFEKDNPKVSSDLTLKRKEELLIQILEVLESREAEIFASAILKKLESKVPGLTLSIVTEVFNGILD